MKKLIKAATVALAAVISLASFAGCKKPSANSSTDIEISFWIAGFGEKFIDDIIAGFNEKYPEYNAYKKGSTNSTTLVNTLRLGKNDSTDIYFNSQDNLKNYRDLFMNLEDVVNEKIDGEDKTIAEKYDEQLFRSLKNPDGSLNMLGWAGGITGIMYNADIINGKDYKVPKTSKQLQMLTQSLLNDKRYDHEKFTPFVTFADGGYYSYLVKAWMAQYSGIDYYNDTWLMLKDADGKSPSKEVYTSKTDGKYAALEAMTAIFSDKTLLYKSNSDKKDEAQTKFVQGKAAMMVNGTWMYNEAEGSGSKTKDFRIMRTPVINAIIDKCESIEDDEELAAVVTAVDEVLDNGADVVLSGDDYEITQKDWDTVFNARRLTYQNGSDHSLIVNKYTNAKEGVKKFIKYYYSDEGLSRFINATHASATARITDESKINTEGWTENEKRLYNDSSKLVYVTDGNAVSPMFTNNVMKVYGELNVVLLMSRGDNPKSAAEIWKDFEGNVTQNWSKWLNAAGYEEIKP